ncbi:hypothetical protein DBR11_23365 [Pedobacter sp. HMWF019]|uniref:hypothetical protein n=1 Tax=Pedobacter sp. HMWF019 TaxID=2056856 RepID=UPI000D3C7233|nr:hypothetical protein [Pedobacter sp. HMWF019]PTS94452.1 hypothetical protein DBR11_23365 [Pedobacter sp. HMWF019]
MNNLKNIITGLQFAFAIATVLTFGLEMNQQIACISFLMLGTFLFFTFYLISLDRKSSANKTYQLLKKRRNDTTRIRNEGEPAF